MVDKLIISEQGKEWELKVERFPITMGRGANNTIVLADPKASRQHCIIEETEKGVVARDLGSRNGTTVNGQRIEVAVLKEGDIIGIGDTLIFYGKKSELPKEEEEKRRFVLVVVEGEGVGNEYPLVNLPVTIGRKTGNRIVLVDEHTSGEHAIVTYENGEYILKDMDSRNGTYVGEQKISREVLSHGKRFRIASTVFEFRDLTLPVPQPPLEKKEEEKKVEKEMPVIAPVGQEKKEEVKKDEKREEKPAAELPPEERVISLDAERAKKVQPSMAPMILVGVLGVFIVAAVLYFAYVVVQTVVHKGRLPHPPESLITKNWSFEEVTEKGDLVGWQVEAGECVVDDTQKKSGIRSVRLDLSKNPSQDAKSLILYSQRIAVTPKCSYILRGWVRSEECAGCGLGVRYISGSRKDFNKEEFTQLVSGTTTGFSSIRGVFEPLPGVDEIEVFCVAFGNTGVCWFDDIELEERKERTNAPLQTAKGYSLRYDSNAVIDFFFEGELLVQDGELVLYGKNEQPSLLTSQKTCRVLDAPTSGADGITFKGDIRGKIAGRWYRFAQKIKKSEDDISVVYSFPTPLPEEMVVSFGLRVPERVSGEGIVLVTPSGQKTTNEQFEEPVVSEIVLKAKAGEVVIRFEPGLAASAVRKNDYLHIRCAVYAKDLVENKFSITFSPFSAMRKKGAIEQMEKVRGLFVERKFKEALDLLRTLKEEPVLSGGDKEELAQIEKSINELTEEWISTAQQMAQDAISEPKMEYIVALKRLCAQVQNAYPEGYNFDRVKMFLEDATGAYEKRAEKERQERVEQLIGQAKQYENKRLFGFAVAFWRYVEKTYPDTLWAKDASAQLELLKKKRQE